MPKPPTVVYLFVAKMWIELFLLVFSVLLGGWVVSFLHSNYLYYIKLLLAFSGGFLLSIAFIHFIPELYHEASEKIGIWILLGFLIQLILEYFSGGVEHGHIHHHGAKVPLTMLFSLSVHSFIEGIPLASEGLSGHHHGGLDGQQSLLIGILLHQFPVAIALMTVLLNAQIGKTKAWYWLIFFALMTPLGMIFGYSGIFNQLDFSVLLAVVVGMFLHISTTIIFETNEHHKFNLVKLMTILAGVGLAVWVH